MVFTGTSYFGEFARQQIPVEIQKRHYKKALLASDKDLMKCGITGKIEAVLKGNCIPYIIFDDIKPNPTIENVQHGVEQYKSGQCDFIIAVGGGSVIDTAKAVAAISTNPENDDVVSLEGMDKSRNPAAPLIAVPTTAGTGSETTMDYVITNVQQKRKMACMNSMGIPVVAVIDTDIMASLPLKLTAATAMDALTHAVESYTAKGAFSFSEVLSLKAVSLISENFCRVLQKPADYEVRKQLGIAQYLAGMSFTNVGLGIIHAMAHPLSAFYDIPHGIANALILPYGIEFNADVCPEKIVHLAEVLVPDFDSTGNYKSAASCCIRRIHEFTKTAGLPQYLCEIGVQEKDFDDLALSASEDIAASDNPKPVNAAAVKMLYQRMFREQ
jgi:lactaldehyde reductase